MVAILFAYLSTFAAGDIPIYEPVAQQSQLTFVASYDGTGFAGEFETFAARFCFDPERPEESWLEVTVNLDSVNTENTDRDETLDESAWFDIANHPTAIYRSEGVEAGESRQYRAAGTLTMKDQTGLVPIDFDWTMEGDEIRVTGGARMVGDTQINRMDFNIGDGDWSDPELIGHRVDVAFDLILQRIQAD